MTRRHVLGDGVEDRRDRVFLGGPVTGKQVVRLATKQQGIEALDVREDVLPDDVVDERRLPAAERKPTLGIFLQTTRRLCDAVKGREQIDVNQSHVASSSGNRAVSP